VPTEEEFVLYLNHPGDALKTIDFQQTYGDPNQIPLDVWFEGLERRQELQFADSQGKPHKMQILDISPPRKSGVSVIRYLLDSEIFTTQVQVATAKAESTSRMEMAEPGNVYHVAAPSNGDLWVMYASAGDFVISGEEIFNISIMKQEKAVAAPVDGVVRRVLKTANYKENKKMVPVTEGELLVELGPAPHVCMSCQQPVAVEEFNFCPHCGTAVEN
jgi:pyruvate carboxylase